LIALLYRLIQPFEDQTMNRILNRLFAGAGLLLAASVAQAHTGHGTHGFFAGLEHPFGLDHLLAMVAVGVWSSVALRGARQWLGPLSFVTALTVGAALGVAGMAMPGVESLIALSVVMFGAMLLLARHLPVQAGLSLVAASALLHGLAHGAEIPVGSTFAAYALGFVMTTAALHLGGLVAGRWVQRTSALAQVWTWRAAAAALSGAGVWMLARV
jgi:urease accessory protein